MTFLLDSTAVAVRPAGVVAVTGHDRLGYLHTLLSQHLEQATPGTVADFLYLDAKGNALASGRAVVRAGEVLLVTGPECAADLAAALEKYKFLMQVEAVDASERYAFASVRGPGDRGDGWLDLPGARPEPMTAAPHGDGVVVRDRSGGVDLLGLADWVAARVAGLGLPRASEAEWDAWRILAGEPAWSTEISAGRRAQELGLLPTHVHLRKGCYPGQESIAKTYNLGRPRRALTVVELDGPVEPGARLDAGGKSGTVTSAAPVDGRWVALALLPLNRDGDILGDGSVSGEQAGGRVLRRVGEGLPQPGA